MAVLGLSKYKEFDPTSDQPITGSWSFDITDKTQIFITDDPTLAAASYLFATSDNGAFGPGILFDYRLTRYGAVSNGYISDTNKESGVCRAEIVSGGAVVGVDYAPAGPVQRARMLIDSAGLTLTKTGSTVSLEASNGLSMTLGRDAASALEAATYQQLGYVPSVLYSDIATVTSFPVGTKRYCTDIKLTVRYNGTGWEPVESIYSAMPLLYKFVKTSPPNTATYTQSGYTITCNWTSHSIPAQYDGALIYLPASSSIAAGWYFDFAYVDANSFTCRSLVSQTVTSETPSSNTAEIFFPTIYTEPTNSLLIPNGAQAQWGLYWDGKNSAATKSLRMYSYGSQINTTATRTTAVTIAAVTSSTIIPTTSNKFFVVGANPSTPVLKADATHKISLQSSSTDSWAAVVAGFMQVRK